MLVWRSEATPLVQDKHTPHSHQGVKGWVSTAEEKEQKLQEEQERRKLEEERKAKQAQLEQERALKAAEEKRKEEILKKERRDKGVCQHCGGEFKGWLIKKCSTCGKRKDY